MPKKRRRLPLATVIHDYLIPYQEEHGNLLVPSLYTPPDGFQLGEWVKKRRLAKAKGTLPADQVNALDAIGFVWAVHGLDVWKQAARNFRDRYGHLDVPQAYVDPDGVPLGKRINGARDGLRRGTLEPATKAFLDGLDPHWAAMERRQGVGRCEVEGCGQVHYARGWCRRHYSNWHRHGDPVPPMRYGMADGHGVYGKLATGDDGGLICHECGQERRFLGRHVRVHGMDADQYREAHGLGRSTPLISDGLRSTFSEKAAARVGSPEWERFEAARDVDAARQESLRALREPLRAQALEARRKQAAAASRTRSGRVCDVEGCGRKHVADGLCRTHYERRKRTGDVQADVPVAPRKGGPRPR